MANGEEKLNTFRMVLRSHPVTPLAPRYFKYDMPKFGEPGMLMAEIPALSRMQDYVVPHGRPHGAPGRPKHTQEIETLEFTPDMITAFYSSESAPAQGKMLRNFWEYWRKKCVIFARNCFCYVTGATCIQG
ncbi:hypothetical protein ABC733_11395 [Mangrovibacter sp. SLW1]